MTLDLFDPIYQRGSPSSQAAAERSSKREHLAQQDVIVMHLATLKTGETRSMAEVAAMTNLPINIICLRLSKDELRSRDVEEVKNARESSQIAGVRVLGFRLTESGRRRAAALHTRER